MKKRNHETMKCGYLSSRGGQYKKYGKAAKRQLALAVVTSLMMGGTPVFAETTVIPYEVNGGAMYSSGNVVEVNDTEAVISNSNDTFGTGQKISKGDGWQSIYGYQGSEKETSGNTVTVTGTTVSNYISGGGTGTSKNNKVIVDSTTNESIIAGGTSDEGDASSNEVTVQNNSKTQAVYGGYAMGNASNANHNSVILTGSTADREVAGGYVEKGSGNAAGNTVTIDNGTVGESIPNSSPYVAGGYVGSSGGNVTDNILTISGTTTLYAGSVAGGYHGGNKDTAASDTYVVSGNQLRMTGGTFKLPDIVAGGRAFNTHVKDNVLTITGDTSVSSFAAEQGIPVSLVKLYGGSTTRGNVLHNTVYIDSTGTLSLNTITGGNSDTDEDNDTKVSGNTVTIKNGNIYLDNNDGIRGGAADYGNVTGNGVIISGSTVGAHQYAEKMRIVGGSINNGNATNNYVNISGGTIDPSYKARIIGGYSQSGTASGNVVNLSGGTLGAENKIVNVVAGEGPVVADNAINLSGSTDITYANLYGYTRTLDGDSADASNEIPDSHSGNALNIGYASKLKTDENGYEVLDGGEASIWNGGTVNGIYKFDKIAFYAINPANTVLAVTNTADLTDTAIDLSNLSFSDNGAAVKSGRTITLLENVKNVDIRSTGLKEYRFDYDLKSADETNSLAASSLYEAKAETNAAHSDAENLILKPGTLQVSTVNLSAGTLDWGSNDSVLNLGSYDFDFSQASLSLGSNGNMTITGTDTLLAAGNSRTLVDGTKAGTVTGLDAMAANNSYSYDLADGAVTVTGSGALKDNGKNLDYTISSIDKISYGTLDWKTGGTVVSLDAGETYDLANTKVDTANISFTANSLQSITSAGNYAMTLLDTKGNTTLSAGNLTAKEGKWDIGNALTGKGIASLDSNGNVVYQMETTNVETGNGGQTVPVVTATEQTHQALIANEAGMGTLAAGRDRMEGVLDGLQNQGNGTITFASIGGGRDRYDTGSSVTTHTWNGVAGIGNDIRLTSGDLTCGVFYEYGKGNYDVSGDGYAGSGDVHYNGGGIMGKFIGKNKTYVEGSLRFGQLDNDADSVLHGTDGSAQRYRTSQNYWAGHVGVGHIFNLTHEAASESRGGTERAVRDLDVYGKYFHTHLGGDTFTAGDVNYAIDSMNSDVLRIGARINNRSGRNNLYYGLAWDYEFDGESTGRVSAGGLSAPIRKADVGGSSLMAEAGWKLEATPENPWEVNLSLKAYAGQHEGLGGNIWAAYHF